MSEFKIVDDEDSKIDCPDHQPVKHRDGKPPWCKKCGLTAGGTKPISVWELPSERSTA